MSTALESLFKPEDLKALETMAKPVDETPAVPVVAPVETPAVVAPAAAPVVETPEPVTLQDLAVLQAEAVANISKLAEALTKRDLAAGVVEKPKNDEARQALFQKIVSENPELEELVRGVFDLQDRQKALEARTEQLGGDAALEAATAQQVKVYESEARDLVATFPGLAEADLKKVFDWLGDEANNEQARRMSVRMVAEKVHGYAYLDARRTPPGVVRDGQSPSAPPALPPATLVTISAPGSPGAPPAGATPEPGGDLRSTFQSILSDPASRARLGKFGS